MGESVTFTPPKYHHPSGGCHNRGTSLLHRKISATRRSGVRSGCWLALPEGPGVGCRGWWSHQRNNGVWDYQKLNMEAENDGFPIAVSFSIGWFSGSMLNFRGGAEYQWVSGLLGPGVGCWTLHDGFWISGPWPWLSKFYCWRRLL